MQLKSSPLARLVDLLGIGAAVTTLAIPLARFWWPLEILSHFRVQSLVALGFCAPLLLACGRRRGAAGCGILAAVNLALIAPLYLSGGSALPADTPSLRIMTFNVHGENRDHAATLEYLTAEDPDVALLLEVTPGLADALEPFKATHAFGHLRARPGSFGIGLLSRVEVEAAWIQQVGRPSKPALLAHLKHQGRRVTLIGVHTMPPKGGSGFRERNSQLADLADLAASQSAPVVLAGDLNVTSWSPFFRDLLRTSRLRDSRPGFGIQPTWPAGNRLLRIPIDHVLVSDRVGVRSRKIGPRLGSDHLAVICEVTLASGLRNGD